MKTVSYTCDFCGAGVEGNALILEVTNPRAGTSVRMTGAASKVGSKDPLDACKGCVAKMAAAVGCAFVLEHSGALAFVKLPPKPEPVLEAPPAEAEEAVPDELPEVNETEAPLEVPDTLLPVEPETA